jgi:hypothetical protein
MHRDSRKWKTRNRFIAFQRETAVASGRWAAAASAIAAENSARIRSASSEWAGWAGRAVVDGCGFGCGCGCIDSTGGGGGGGG